MLFIASFAYCDENVIWKFKKITEQSGATSYIFENPGPVLTLNSDASTSKIEDINAALKFIGLPEINQNVRDEGILGRMYRGQYRWDDYSLGKLEIRRTLATDSKTYKKYDAIWKITIDSKR